MGFFKFGKKKEFVITDELKEEGKKKAEQAYAVYERTFDPKQMYEALVGHSLFGNEVTSFTDEEILYIQCLYARHFEVDLDRLEKDFVKNVLASTKGALDSDKMVGRINFCKGASYLTNPLDFSDYPANRWAKGYLRKNKDVVLSSSVYRRVQAACIATRAKEEKCNLFDPSFYEIRNEDLNGASDASKLIFAKGLFDYSDYRASLRIIFNYKQLAREDYCQEILGGLNVKSLFDAFNIEPPTNYDEYLRVLNAIFINENGEARNEGEIVSFVRDILGREYLYQ